MCDLASEDLLSHLPSVIQFISQSQGQHSGAVLLHCFHGRSRAAAIVMAYLMHKYKYSVEKSFEILKSKRKCVKPNPGFMAQLRLWEAMRFKLQQDFLRYKMYKLQTVSHHLRKCKIISGDVVKKILEPDPLTTGRSAKKSSIVYKCKGCRRLLATCDNVIPHLQGENSSWAEPVKGGATT